MAKKKRAASASRLKTSKKTAKKKSSKRGRKAHKRKLIDTGRDKRYVRRDNAGEFHEVDEQSRSLSQDRRRKAKTVVKAGQGDKGDQAPRKKRKKK